MDEAWRPAFRRYPQLLAGGATLHETDGRVYALAVGSAKTPAAGQSENARLVADADARRNLVKYLAGFKLRADTVAVEETAVAGDGESSELVKDVVAYLRKTEMKAGGAIPGMKPVGNWKSADGTRLYIAYVADVKDALPGYRTSGRQ